MIRVEKHEVVPPCLVRRGVGNELRRIFGEHPKTTLLPKPEVVARELHHDRIDFDDVDRCLREPVLQKPRVRSATEADQEDPRETFHGHCTHGRHLQIHGGQLAGAATIHDRLVDAADPTEAEVAPAGVVDDQ